MSRHCYRTTTLEYYEFVPDTREYGYESVVWPWQTDSYGAVNYLSNLQDNLSMVSDDNQHREFIYDIVQCPQPQAVFEFAEQEHPDTTYLAPLPVHDQDQTRNLAEDNENESSNVDTVVSEPQTTNKPRRKKNIYRAKQGYLVEEPSSESEGDHDATT